MNSGGLGWIPNEISSSPPGPMVTSSSDSSESETLASVVTAGMTVGRAVDDSSGVVEISSGEVTSAGGLVSDIVSVVDGSPVETSSREGSFSRVVAAGVVAAGVVSDSAGVVTPHAKTQHSVALLSMRVQPSSGSGQISVEQMTSESRHLQNWQGSSCLTVVLCSYTSSLKVQEPEMYSKV